MVIHSDNDCKNGKNPENINKNKYLYAQTVYYIFNYKSLISWNFYGLKPQLDLIRTLLSGRLFFARITGRRRIGRALGVPLSHSSITDVQFPCWRAKKRAQPPFLRAFRPPLTAHGRQSLC